MSGWPGNTASPRTISGSRCTCRGPAQDVPAEARPRIAAELGLTSPPHSGHLNLRYFMLLSSLCCTRPGLLAASGNRVLSEDACDYSEAQWPSDLLERCFDAPVPNRRWVAGITYVMTIAGWAYTAFVMDLFARRILGWQVADHLRSDLALDPLEMAIWARRHESIDGLVHHSGLDPVDHCGL